MSMRLVTKNSAKGEYHLILDPAIRGELILDHVCGAIDCSDCDECIPTLAQIILKRDDRAGVVAILCLGCALKHIEAARDRAVAFVRGYEPTE